MRKRWHIALWGCMFMVFASHANRPETLDALFMEGKKAYDTGAYADAIMPYETIYQKGYYHPHLFYNWGNALYKSGSYGKALWQYERARLLAPNDPDIEANIRFVREQLGIVPPDTLPLWNWLRTLSPTGWITVIILTYWLSALGLVVLIWRNTLRTHALWVIIPAMSILLMATAGMLAHQQTSKNAIALEKTRALFSPLEDSTPSFDIKEGMTLRVLEQRDEWLRVQFDDLSGWVKASELGRLTL